MKPRTLREEVKRMGREEHAASCYRGKDRGEEKTEQEGRVRELMRHHHARPLLQVAEGGALAPLHSGLLFYKQQTIFTRERLVFLWCHKGLFQLINLFC